MDGIISTFGKEIKKVVFGFTPLLKDDYEYKEIYEEDTTLFVKGDIIIDLFEKNHLRFLVLART
ncbi:MAG: hypothetical protein GX198_00675 [Epulopiscium sp.]|nr:hypothetical protein [Candidatus Epulonipiscium sp.]